MFTIPSYTGLDDYKVGEVITVRAIVKTERFFNEDGFGIYVVEADGDTFVCKGSFVAPLYLGQTYEMRGKVVTYKEENQLQLYVYKPIEPTTKRGIISYMQTLHGLKKRAADIYAMFGDDSVEKLLNEPLEISKLVPGIGKKSVIKWSEQLKEQKKLEEMMIALLGYGLSAREVQKLYAAYKEKIVTMIADNPYFLAKEVRGYGFIKCDRIAKNLGYQLDGIERVKAGMHHALEMSLQNGHSFLFMDELILASKHLLGEVLEKQAIERLLTQKGDYVHFQKEQVQYTIEKSELVGQDTFTLFAINDEVLVEAVTALVHEERILIEDERVYLRQMFFNEVISSKHIARLVEEGNALAGQKKFDDELKRYLTSEGFQLEGMQRKAVEVIAAKEGGVFVLNGSAGTGKTFTLKIILQMVEWAMRQKKKTPRVLAFAPTGKASKVASRAMGRPCSTIHRGIGYQPGNGFTFNRENPLDCNVLVIDEATMVDLELLYGLLEAVKTGTKVIFVGDYKQLPSVGAGNCFKDFIDSASVKTITLDVVKRQAEKSGLLKNANRIIAGQMIESEPALGDMFILEQETNEAIVKFTVKSLERLLKKGYTQEEVQVLAPMRNGAIGTYYFNYVLQEKFNPRTSGEKEVFWTEFSLLGETKKLYFRAGDKVIHIKNNYDLEWQDKHGKGLGEFVITNGETGVIESITEVMRGTKKVLTMKVRYDDKYMVYEDDFSELEMAYALSIHKSQGSQWKAVLLPWGMSYYHMLQNNLLYTALTRAQEFAAIIGQKKAIRQAIHTTTTQARNSYLTERIDEKSAA